MFVFHLLSITAVFFTLYLPFITSSFPLSLNTILSPFRPVELSLELTLALISACLLPVLAHSFHLAPLAISHHLPADLVGLIPPPPPFPLSGYPPIGDGARVGDGNGDRKVIDKLDGKIWRRRRRMGCFPARKAVSTSANHSLFQLYRCWSTAPEAFRVIFNNHLKWSPTSCQA